MYDARVKPSAACSRRLPQDKAEVHIESSTLCAQPSGAAFLPTMIPEVVGHYVNVQIRWRLHRPIAHRPILSRDRYSTYAQARCNIRRFHPPISLQLQRYTDSGYVNARPFHIWVRYTHAVRDLFMIPSKFRH